jgi:histidyl-tRNA synthetase
LLYIFEQWGFGPIETPTLEALALFEGQIGEGESMFFKFEDNGGRKVALRYDQSVLCHCRRSFSKRNYFPFKRYQIQSAFERKHQKGRYREFIQCDADIFGVSTIEADAEIIALSISIYKQLGFKEAVVYISDRALLKDLPYEAIVAIDKLDKIGEQGVLDEMVTKDINLKQAKIYLDTALNCKPNANIEYILNYLKKLGFDESWYKFEPSLARSFSYSSGPIWEVKIPGFNGSVLGGERFDNVIKKISGADIPATGFGLGFDRTYEAMEQFNLLPITKTTTKVLVANFGPETDAETLGLVKLLRENNINTLFYPTSEKLGKQFKYADALGIPFVAMIGTNEAAENQVTIKNMTTGEQNTINQSEILKLLL